MPQSSPRDGAPKPKKLLDQVRDRIRLKNYFYRTEKSAEKNYVSWIKRFILYHNKRHPREMGHQEIEAFLTYLAVDRNVAPSTQNQALHAITLRIHFPLLKPPLERRLTLRRRQPDEQVGHPDVFIQRRPMDALSFYHPVG